MKRMLVSDIAHPSVTDRRIDRHGQNYLSVIDGR